MRVVLWILAVVLGLGTMVYQRYTGPTYPKRGKVETKRYKLLRSAYNDSDARIAIPNLGNAKLHYKRFGTKDAFTTIPMRVDGEERVADLPAQPAAGKLEYYIDLSTVKGDYRLPEDENVVIRFKNPVPLFIWLPHVVCMVLSVVLGLRTGLAALFQPDRVRRLAWITLVCLTVGGLILGPIMQKYAFGEFWTGWPKGEDLTDTKTLVAWVGWLAACLLAGRGRRRGRVAAVAATLVMMAVYLIPHSMWGSELDYDQLDKGVDPVKAIKTG